MNHSTAEIEKKLNKIIQLPVLQKPEYANFLQRAQDLVNYMNEKEFRITVVGEFSAGKSTFLNALIGKDILPHSVNETTATVTYIKNVSANHPLCNKVEVKFFGEREALINELPSDAKGLTEYVTTMAQQMNVVEEVASVTVYVDFPYTDEPIVFIDTPGLNGVAKGHYERTRYEIQNAHTSIYLLHTRGLSQSNVEMYELLKQYQSSFVFVINAIDTLKASEGETVELKVEELKRQLKQIGVVNEPTIMGVSALLALTAKDQSITQLFESDEIPLTTERREQLLQRSNFMQIENEIWKRIATSDKEQLKLENLEKKVTGLVNEVMTEFEEQVAIHQITLDEKQLNDIELRLSLAAASKQDNLRTINNFISAKKSDIRTMLINLVKDDMQQVNQSFEKEITHKVAEFARVGELPTPDELIKGLHEKVKKDIQAKESHYSVQYADNLSKLLADLFESAVLRIEKHYPKIAISKQGLQFSVALERSRLEDLSLVQKINAVDKKLAQVATEHEKELQQFKVNQQKAKKVENELNSLQREKQQLFDQQHRQIRNLGSRPQPRQKTESYTVEKSGLWSSVKSFFGGSPSYETRTRTVTDTSARDRWDEQERKIKNDFSQRERSLTTQLSGVKARLSQAESSSMQNESRVLTYQNQAQSLTRDLAILNKEKQEIYNKNKQIYYNKQRNDLLAKVSDYLTMDLAGFYRNEIERILAKEITHIEKEIGRYYEETYTNYTKKLKQLKQQVLKESVPQEREKAEIQLKLVKKALV